jgi:hypothetical protein
MIAENRDQESETGAGVQPSEPATNGSGIGPGHEKLGDLPVKAMLDRPVAIQRSDSEDATAPGNQAPHTARGDCDAAADPDEKDTCQPPDQG